MQTANPKTAQTNHGGNTTTTSQAPEMRRVRTAPGQLSDWQEAPQSSPTLQAAPEVVPVKVKRAKVAQVASTTQDLPAWHALSFIKTQQTRHGLHCLDWLAVPPQTYSEGWITGLRVMDELMAHVNGTRANGQHYGGEYALQSVAAAAFAEVAKPMSARGEAKDKRGAAQAVIHCLTRFMVSVDMVSVGGNRCLPMRHWLRHEIDYQTRMNAELAQEEAERKAAWATRMQAARKAKQQAKKEAKAQGVAA